MKHLLKSIALFCLCVCVMSSCGGEQGEQKENYLYVPGAIQGAFSISKNSKVSFSQGNLQYQASTETWRFAEHQYDIIGKDNDIENIENISSTYDGWIDLFGWGTSGYKGRDPYEVSSREIHYGVVGNVYASIACTNFDWGVNNAISNGGNAAGMWRTLTNSEWEYVVLKRRHAKSLRGSATVNGVTGMILLPDNWTTPDGISFNRGMERWDDNTYSTTDWKKMEANGAVFLPAAGSRSIHDDGPVVINVGYVGDYWSSSAYYSDDALRADYNAIEAYILYFSNDEANMSSIGREHGFSVRLVRGL